MCELLGISCNKHVDPKFSLKEWKTQNRQLHGWGIAWVQENQHYFTIVKEYFQSNKSKFIREILNLNTLKSKIFVSHIRTSGNTPICPLNNHPFELSLNPESEVNHPGDTLLKDKSWVFIHNGVVTTEKFTEKLKELKPHGDTDSEAIFCWIIEKLRENYPFSSKKEMFEKLYEILQTEPFKDERSGINFLMSDGEHLIAYYGGYGGWKSNGGLHYLLRSGSQINAKTDSSGINIDLTLRKDSDEKAVIVSTKEKEKSNYDITSWIPFNENQMIVFKDGEIFFDSKMTMKCKKEQKI